MQTQLKPYLLQLLESRLDDLRGDIIEARFEVETCPDRRDADGCFCDCDYGDACDHLDALERELETIEEQIDALTNPETR